MDLKGDYTVTVPQWQVTTLNTLGLQISLFQHTVEIHFRRAVALYKLWSRKPKPW